MNSVNLIGRLTKDPEVRYSDDGRAFARYTLAVDRNADDTDFIRCVCFNACAEFAEKHLSKGMKVGVNGSIRTGSYENDEGVTIYTTDVFVSSHTFCELKKDTCEGKETSKRTPSKQKTNRRK